MLQELYAVLTRRFRPLVPAATAAIILSAIATHQHHAVSFWDALIVQAVGADGAERVLSEDLQDGLEIEGVLIENPFRAAKS